MIALRNIAWTLFYRNRVILSVTLGFIFVFGVLLAAVGYRHLPELVIAWGVLGLGLAILVLIAVLMYQDADVGASGSQFPSHMFSLPLRTPQMVLIPMALGSLTLLTSGLFLTTATKVGGMNVAIWWPPCLAVAVLAVLQTIFWYPIGIPYAKFVLTLVLLPGICIACGSMLTNGTSEATIAGSLIAVTALCYAITCIGVGQARRGDIIIWNPDRPRTATPAKKQAPPFRSAQAAQRWYEWRQHGIILPALVLFVFIAFCIPMIWNDTFTPIGLALDQSRSTFMMVPTYIEVYLPVAIGLILIVAVLVGYGVRRSDMNRGDRTFHLFFGVRPLTDSDLVAQKLWSALKSTLWAWGLFLACGAHLLTMPARTFQMSSQFIDNTPHTIFELLLLGLSGETIRFICAGLFLLAGLTYRNYIVGFWAEMSDRLWVRHGCPVALGLIATNLYVFALTHPQSVDSLSNIPNICAIVWTLVIVKLVLSGLLASRHFDNGLLTSRTIWRSLATYAVIGAVFTWVALFFTAPWRNAFVEQKRASPEMATALVVGLTLLWIPITRVLLAISMLNRNRHRAK
ncbi:MAG: hypothetical protein JST12_02490 [Armatimonadetes bacterium]|nr:hypothetical protein [Armatimonadota bacterium]